MIDGCDSFDFDVDTFRRNSFNAVEVSTCSMNNDSSGRESSRRRPAAHSPITRSHTTEPNAASTRTSANKPSSRSAINDFNDMGHLSRRICGNEEQVPTSTEFNNSFGLRVVLDNKEEATAITPTTIAKCISSELRRMVAAGEKYCNSTGHINAPCYDIFCGGGKNRRILDQSSTPLSTSMKSPLAMLAKRVSGQSSSVHPSRNVPTAKPLANNPPPLKKFEQFVSKLCIDTQMEYECIVITLIYIRRLIKSSKGALVLLGDNWKGVVLACAMLANKVWDDFHMMNSDYAYVFPGLSLERVNGLELKMLQCIDNRCNVSPSLYAQTHFEIQEMIARMSIEKERSRKYLYVKGGSNKHLVPKMKKTKDDKIVPLSCAKGCSVMTSPSICSTTERTLQSMDDMDDNSPCCSNAEFAGSTGVASIEENSTALPFIENDGAAYAQQHPFENTHECRNLHAIVQYDLSPKINRPSRSRRESSFKLSKERSRKSFRSESFSQASEHEDSTSSNHWGCVPAISGLFNSFKKKKTDFI